MKAQLGSNAGTAAPADRNAWTALALLWVAFFLNQADRQVLPGVLPLVAGEFGLNAAQLGLVNSCFHWVYALLVPVAGWLGDRFNRKHVLFLTVLAWSLTTGLTGFTGGFLSLLILRAATGAGEACYLPAATSLIVDLHGTKGAGFAISVHQSANYVGVAIAGAIAGWIGEHYGWRVPFMGFGLLGIGLACLLSWRLKEPLRERPDAASANQPLGLRLKMIFATRSFYWLVFAFIGMLLANTAYLAWMPALLHQRFGLSLAAAGLHAAIYHQAGAILGVLIGGKISDAWVQRTVLGRPFTQLLGLVLGAPFIVVLGLSEQKWVVYTALGVFGVFRGIYDSNLFTSLFLIVPPQIRSLATGVLLALGFLGGGFAPWLVGLLSTPLGLGPALACCALGYVGGALVLGAGCLMTFREDVARASANPSAALPSSP